MCDCLLFLWLYVIDTFADIYVTKVVSDSIEYCASNISVITDLWPICSEHNQTSSGLTCWCYTGHYQCFVMNTHTHTHPFNSPFLGLF